MTDPIVLEEGKVYKVKPPMMNVGALYQLARYAYENDLRFTQCLYAVANDSKYDLLLMENTELERQIKDFLANAKNQTDKG